MNVRVIFLAGAAAVCVAFGWLFRRKISSGKKQIEVSRGEKKNGTRKRKQRPNPLPPSTLSSAPNPPPSTPSSKKLNDKPMQYDSVQIRNYLMILIEYLKKDELEKAERIADELIVYAQDNIGDHIDLAYLLGLPLANVYMKIHNRPKLEYCLKKAFEIFVNQENGMSLLVESTIADRLLNFYEDDPAKALACAFIIVDVLRKNYHRTPDNLEAADIFCTSIASAATILTRQGQFKHAMTLHQEVIDVIFKTDGLPANTIQTYFTAYAQTMYQQGRIDNSIYKLEAYRRKAIQNRYNSGYNAVVMKIVAKLMLAAEKYEQILEYINLLAASPHCDVQLLCDLATAYWELGNIPKAKKIEERIKNSTRTLEHPFTISKYMTTLDCSLLEGSYKLKLKLNEVIPSRKEGQPPVITTKLLNVQSTNEQKSSVVQKTKLYWNLHITFEGTGDNKPVQNETKIIRISPSTCEPIEIESPKMPLANPGTWYEVSIDIRFNDKIIATHKQLVFANH